MIDYIMLIAVGIFYLCGFGMMGFFTKSQKSALPERYRK